MIAFINTVELCGPRRVCVPQLGQPAVRDQPGVGRIEMSRMAEADADISLASISHGMLPVECSSPEHKAIVAGTIAGKAALERSRSSGLLELFVRGGQSPRVEPRLEVLRAYAELRRVLAPHDRKVPVTSLLAAGFTAGQIAHFDAIIAA